MQTHNSSRFFNESQLDLILSGGFQELVTTNDSARVFRHHSAGITIYVHDITNHLCKPWQGYSRYILIYEREFGYSATSQQIVIQSEDPHAVCRTLELLTSHVKRVLHEVHSNFYGHHGRQVKAPTLEILDLDIAPSFADTQIRNAIQHSLKQLSNMYTDNSYAGFINIVQSVIDDWLTAQTKLPVTDQNITANLC